jgi:LEA14-like dessication related protein
MIFLKMRGRTLRSAALLLLVLFGLGSCNYEDPEFSNVRNIRFRELDGRKISLDLTVDCDNPNKFGFKVKKSTLDITVDNELLGVVYLDEKIKIKRLSNNAYDVPLSITLADGAMFRLIKYVKREKVDVQITGKVRGSVFGFSKSFDVKETRTIDGSALKMDLQGL